MSAFQITRAAYMCTLPKRPYCTNQLGRRLRIMDAEKAAGYAIIQHNSPLVWQWLVFDIDDACSHTRAEERGCPPPTFIALNRDNGHGHAAYLLEAPVSAFEKSSRRAMKFYEDVERGLTNRLGADSAYAGFLSKNPLSSRWETDWQAVRPYRLDTLNDYLDPSDKKRPLTREPSLIGRNVTIFNAVRSVAYKQCLNFKKSGKPLGEFEKMLREVAAGVNNAFPLRLSLMEINGIARSVSEWVWGEFSVVRFSAIQRARAFKRFRPGSTITARKPWEVEGISRSTWYRQRTSSPLIPLLS